MSTRVIDTSSNCLGHLDQLKSEGVECIGRYYASQAWKRITQTEARAISAAGMQLFMVFEDSGAPALTVDRGRNDAQLAMGQARHIGQPQGSAIYFALENLPHGYSPADIPHIQLYFEGVRRVLAGTYKVGCYSNGSTLAALLDAKLIDYAWVSASTSFHGTKDFLAGKRWHLAQRKVDLDWAGVSADTNDVNIEDFGAFQLPVPESASAPSTIESAIAGATAGAVASVAADEPLPAVAAVADAKPKRDLDYINEMAEQASRLAGHIRGAWTSIKLALGIGTGGTMLASQLVDTNKGNAAVATSWGTQHPWLMLLIGMTVVMIVLGGILIYFGPKIIKGLVSAFKDGRYTPPAASATSARS